MIRPIRSFKKFILALGCFALIGCEAKQAELPVIDQVPTVRFPKDKAGEASLTCIKSSERSGYSYSDYEMHGFFFVTEYEINGYGTVIIEDRAGDRTRLGFTTKFSRTTDSNRWVLRQCDDSYFWMEL